jgi:tetratricopeptide (TPR) repeat protein
MKFRVGVSVVLCAGLALLGGCREKTPAQKAAAVDAKGRNLVLQGEYPQAITLYSDAIANDGSNGSMYFHRGTARLMDASSGGTSSLDDAISDFNLAIKLDPMVQRQAYHARGDAKHLKGDEEGAKEDWQRGDAVGK